MRNAFVKELIEQMNVDENTVLLTADVGWNSFDHIREKYPDRFVNMGLSEQAMAGVAAGMAKMGKNVFMYSIIPFMLYRAFEQVRDDICYPDLSVRLVGTGASFSYGEAGSTHQPFEDLRIASALPNMVVLSPSDPREVEVLFKRMKDVKHPVYMRLGRTGEPIIHNKHDNIVLGKTLKLTDGKDILIVSTGFVTKEALEVAEILNAKDNVVEVIEMHTFKPFDYESVIDAAEGKKLVITVEDNNGALEEKVANALLKAKTRSGFISFKIPDQFTHVSAKQDYILQSYGISPDNIINQIRTVMT